MESDLTKSQQNLPILNIETATTNSGKIYLCKIPLT